MPLQLTVEKKVFRFRFQARTSRGEMPERPCWFLTIHDDEGRQGMGEAAPIFGLSRETEVDLERDLDRAGQQLSSISRNTITGWVNGPWVQSLSPAVRTGLEMAALDLCNGGIRKYFESPFWHGEPVPINGLVWMDSLSAMKKQAFEKLESGFSCIKIKVGAHDHTGECALLADIRKHPLGAAAVIRLDANGAYGESDVFDKLRGFAECRIHSIEQPVRAGQPDLMRRVCSGSPIPVALDEELIGDFDLARKTDLLRDLRPAYVVLKPSLLGGFTEAKQWIDTAVNLNIGWWVTSALESPIGLNAIAQFTSSCHPSMPQGLGTGAIFEQESSSPLMVEKGQIRYEKSISWK